MKKFVVFIAAMLLSSFLMPDYELTWINYLRDLAGTIIIIWGSVYYALHYSHEQRQKKV